VYVVVTVLQPQGFVATSVCHLHWTSSENLRSNVSSSAKWSATSSNEFFTEEISSPGSANCEEFGKGVSPASNSFSLCESSIARHAWAKISASG
jgi:hypothetical protein